MAKKTDLASLNFEATQIKNFLIEKLANETKINEFIRIYFWIGEKKIFDIYEGIVNFFLKTDELWKFKDDFKIFVEEEDWFLLDKMLAWYSIDENKLYELLFEKLKLKRDVFENKGIYVFTRSIFQHGVVENFFDWLKTISQNWKENYIETTINSLKDLVWPSVVKLIKDETIKELMAQTESASEKDIQDNYWYILEWMLNKRLIERNFSSIISKMIEYFKKKNINFHFLIEEYKEFFNYINSTDYIQDIKAWFEIRSKNNRVTKSFVNILKNKQKLLFDTTKKSEVFKDLKEHIGDRKAREFIFLAEKNSMVMKQQMSSQIVLELIINDLKTYQNSLQEIKYKKITLEQLKKKIFWKVNLFYESVEKLLSEYDKEEQIAKIEKLYDNPEDYYDVNILFDDIFQKILKIEEFGLFYDYNNEEVFKQTKETIINFIKTKEEKSKEIIDILEHNKSIILSIGKLYRNNDILIDFLRKKTLSKLNLKKKSILNYLLEWFEEIRNRGKTFIQKQWMNKLFYNILNERIISLTILNDYLLDVKEYANKYDINHLKKELIFVDRFFSPTTDDKMNLLKNFLKIWMLWSIYGKRFRELNIFFENHPYILELRRLYNFENWIKLIKKYTKLYEQASKTKNNTLVYGKEYIEKNCMNVKFLKLFDKLQRFSELQQAIIKENLQSMLKLDQYSKDMNEMSRIFLKFIYDNNELLNMCEDFDNYIYSAEEIDMIYWMYHLINATGVQIESHDDYVLVYFRNKIFVFFSNPTFRTFNSMSLLLEQKKDYEHIFIYTHINFYLYLTWLFSKNINVKWLQQNFKQLMLISFYDDEISDLSMYWDKRSNLCYFKVRKNGKYQMVWFKKADFIQTVFSFSVMDSVIENIIFMGWAITSEKQSDTSIKFWWIKYRIWVMKDWERIGIVMRKAQNAGLRVDLKKYMDENWIVYLNKPLPYKKEWFSLYDTYEEDDVKLMLDYVTQTSWIIVISGSTGSWKSVSMRNFLNHVFESTLKDWYWKKIATFEDPIEAINPNFMQFEFKKDELPSAVLWVKRFDLDVALVWEIRDYTMLTGILEAQDVIATKTTMHSPTVWSALFLLKKWAVASKVDLVDIIYAVKVLMAQKLSFYLKEKYQSPEQQEYFVKNWSIILVYPWSREEEEILNEFHFLVEWVLGKDVSYVDVVNKIKNNDPTVSDFFKNIIHTEGLIKYMITELVKKWVIKYKLKDTVTRRKIYYEMIDRVKMKLEFNIMYTVLTWENLIGREIQEDETDINKLMIKLLKKTREQRALEDFFRGFLDWWTLWQYSKEYFILVIAHMFRKNWVKTFEDVDKFIESLTSYWKIL